MDTCLLGCVLCSHWGQGFPEGAVLQEPIMGHLGGTVVEYLTCFISGCDPRGVGSSPALGSVLSVEFA